ESVLVSNQAAAPDVRADLRAAFGVLDDERAAGPVDERAGLAELGRPELAGQAEPRDAVRRVEAALDLAHDAVELLRESARQATQERVAQRSVVPQLLARTAVEALPQRAV